MALYGGIEGGGTKFICAVGTGPGDVRAQVRIPTTTPEETLSRVVDFFRAQPEAPVALGAGTFGPLELDPTHPHYGRIGCTTKPGWTNAEVGATLREAMELPVAVDTDVNAAALAEHRWGAGQDVDSFVYVTVGTGIGGGAFVEGRPVHGLIHPEMGHMVIPRVPGDDFEGVCPYHANCLEAVASGPALEARCGRPGAEVPPDHAVWDLQARYVALGLVNLISILSPRRIILGGGVMDQRHLFPMVRRYTQEYLGGYLVNPVFEEAIDTYVVPPALGGRAGVLGCLALAQRAHEESPAAVHAP